MLKVLLGGLLGDLPGGSGGTKGMKTGTVSERKNGPALEKGCTRHTRQFYDITIFIFTLSF